MKDESPFELLISAISIPLVMIMGAGCITTGGQGENTDSIQKLEVRVSNLEKSHALMRKTQLRKQYEARVASDRKTFSQEDLRRIESLYQQGNKQWGSAEHKNDLKLLIEKYPGANRAGCAILYLGQMAEGDERVRFFRRAISEHNDCWYGDGVQVGAYARFYLAMYLQNAANTAEAERIYNDIREKYSDSVNHKGALLVDLIPKQTVGR